MPIAEPAMRSLSLVAFLLVTLWPVEARAQLVERRALTLAGARRVVQAAHAEAERQRATVVIAVVDEGGYALVLERRDDTQVASVDVALAKARTAAIFRRPSREFEEQVKNGRLATLALPGAAPLQGGVPIVVEGRCIGAIGVSGNTPQQDEEIALAGAALSNSLATAATPRAVPPREVPLTVIRMSPELDEILPWDARCEQVATGFTFTEGPLWVDGALLFSDPNENKIWRYRENEGLTLFRAQSGYDGADIGEYRQPGSNGLALDPRGRLTICEHGRRRVSQLDAAGQVHALAEHYDGRRLNSPNDLIFDRRGRLFFTDPPFGLPKFGDDPRKELTFAGVFAVNEGRVTRLVDDLAGPNGINLSPDQRTLYVGNWDVKRKVVMRYPLHDDGSVGAGAVFLDLSSIPGDTAIDGIEVDGKGNLYVCGPGGIWIVASSGKILGRILDRPEEAHNLAFGGDDGRTLYVAAQTSIYRLCLRVGPNS
jgi:sugar lactone lactonase YvrE/uncharacterized protein GlcG (DUF336 family)